MKVNNNVANVYAQIPMKRPQVVQNTPQPEPRQPVPNQVNPPQRPEAPTNTVNPTQENARQRLNIYA